ncbi:hypothetical protein CC2G_012868 [Coprinopsis cinerea AmutBmut pab1-1]|nr:hypothetical protein CC2G_012868 [Coprinopsis cinerea AmutBmut pab1-1]
MDISIPVLRDSQSCMIIVAPVAMLIAVATRLHGVLSLASARSAARHFVRFQSSFEACRDNGSACQMFNNVVNMFDFSPLEMTWLDFRAARGYEDSVIPRQFVLFCKHVVPILHGVSV